MELDVFHKSIEKNMSNEDIEDNKSNSTTEEIQTKNENEGKENNRLESFNEEFLNKLTLKIEDIITKYNKFNDVNPMRAKSLYSKNKNLENKNPRTEAIKSIITNLKTQYIIFNIKSFIKNYHIKTNKEIDGKSYKKHIRIRNFTYYIYGIFMLFERPWFCYKGTTIPLPSSFKFQEEKCKNDVVFTGLPFIYNDIQRCIEIMFTVIISVTQILKLKVDYSLRYTKNGVNIYYNIMQIFLFLALFLCLGDSIYALVVGKFPIINFLCRPFIFIYMIRRLRINWVSLLKVLWKTKNAYLILFINIITFSVFGFFLFHKKGGFFDNFGESFLQIYILLTTCNFPDIMLEAMEFSKLAILYFVVCIFVNYFILLSYLNNLYTTKYYEVNKSNCIDIIKDVIDNSYNKRVFTSERFARFLVKQKYLYHLNKEEYNNLLVLLNVYNRNNHLYQRFIAMSQLTPEAELINNTNYGYIILNSKVAEIIINLLYISCTIVIIIEELEEGKGEGGGEGEGEGEGKEKGKQVGIGSLIFHSLTSLLILYEPIILINNLGFNRIIKRHFHRALFYFFNLAVLISLLNIFILKAINNVDPLQNDLSYRILKIFVSLRTIRILVFLDKFRIIKNIYIIIRISKEMMVRNFLTLYSFILIFSTLSMLLIGGNIHYNSFKEQEVPSNYEYINFNDYASSHISCFCLLMINNLNILVKTLTLELGNNLFYEFYFAFFYFFSTLIIINIIQTLILEMYIISDYSLSDKDKNKEKENNNVKLIKSDTKTEEIKKENENDNNIEDENKNDSKDDYVIN